MTDTHEALLIDAVLAGNSAAYGELVCRYQDRLYTTLVHLTGSEVEAQDVAQEAFVQAFLRLETFRRSSRFYTWLYRIAFNTFVSRQRKRQPGVSLDEMRLHNGLEPSDDSAPPEDRLEQQELCQAVRRGLSALAEEFRVVLVLREIEGLDYEAIAGLLGVPVGTVRSRLHRARLHLREQLKEVLPAD